MDQNKVTDMNEESAPAETPAHMDETETRAVIEALMIATTEPLPLRSIAEIAHVSEETVRSIIAELNGEYRVSSRAFEIKEIAGGFQIYTLPRFAEWVGALHKRKERLSKAALETLAIVAYHQPIIRADIENIRGVDATSVLDTLLQKNLIKTCGRMFSPGRPIKYATTKEFLRYFGIRDLSALPKEEDFGERVISGYLEPPPVQGGVAGAPDDGTETGPEDSSGGSKSASLEDSAGTGDAEKPQEDIVDLSEDDDKNSRGISDFTPDDDQPHDRTADAGADGEPVDPLEDIERPDEDLSSPGD